MGLIRILLAEDDADDQELFYDFLKYRTDLLLMPPVENGVSVFDVLESIVSDDDLPHFIILDQNMPKRGGLATLRLLKDNKRYSSIPVMIYSTYADDVLKKSGKEMGASVVVQKPIIAAEYNKMIDLLLKYTCQQT